MYKWLSIYVYNIDLDIRIDPQFFGGFYPFSKDVFRHLMITVGGLSGIILNFFLFV